MPLLPLFTWGGLWLLTVRHLRVPSHQAFVRGGLENEVVGLKLHSYDEDAYKLAEEMEY